jgi:hypothetical protein
MIVKLAINKRKWNEKLDDNIYWINVYTQRQKDNEIFLFKLQKKLNVKQEKHSKCMIS